MKHTKALLIQGYYGGVEVSRRALAAFLAAEGVQTPPPSAPDPIEVVREVIATRAGLSPAFYWQDMPDGYYLMCEGDPKPWGRVPFVSPVDLSGLPAAMRQSLEWLIQRRVLIATPSAIHRALATAAFHGASGITLSNLRGLPGAIAVHRQNYDKWNLLRGRLNQLVPHMHQRIIETETVVYGPVEAAIADELSLAADFFGEEVARLQASRRDPHEQPEKPLNFALAYGRALQHVSILDLWMPSMDGREAQMMLAREKMATLIADLEVTLDIRS